jgi:predicted Zn-dependent protease
MLRWLERRAVRVLYELAKTNLSGYFDESGAKITVYTVSPASEDVKREIVSALSVYDVFTQIEFSTLEAPLYAFNKRRGQLDAMRIAKRFIRRRPSSFSLIILDHDIYAPLTHWAYGMTVPVWGISILSRARYTNSETARSLGLTFTQEETAHMLRRQVGHEVGHLLGLADHKEGEHRGCVMDQTMRLHRKIEAVPRLGGAFCQECEGWKTKLVADVRSGDLDELYMKIAKISFS